MTDQPHHHAPGEEQPPLSEDELRAAYEAELKLLRVEDVILQTVVSLLNLGARKAGLVPGSEDERDLEQARLAIEGVRALLPAIEPVLGENGASLRDALAQLQIAYARLAAGAGGQGEPGEPGEPGASGDASDAAGPGTGPGPAQQSGRLWVPGQ